MELEFLAILTKPYSFQIERLFYFSSSFFVQITSIGIITLRKEVTMEEEINLTDDEWIRYIGLGLTIHQLEKELKEQSIFLTKLLL